MNRQSITGLILAGGRGRRVNEQDKGLLQVAGEPLISHVIARIRPQVGRILLSANRNQARYRELAESVVSDDAALGEEYAGPLAGLLGGLEQAATDYVLVVPCDTPCLPADLAEKLWAGLSPTTPIAIAHDGIRDQQLVMLLERREINHLRQWLQGGGRAVREWLASRDYAVVEFNNPAGFLNLNTVEDVARYEQKGCTDAV